MKYDEWITGLTGGVLVGATVCVSEVRYES